MKDYPYLHLTVNQKLVFAYVLGLVTMAILRTTWEKTLILKTLCTILHQQNLFLAAFCYTIPTCILRKRATIFHICIINAECWTEENYYFILLYNFKEEYYYLLKELVIIIYLYIIRRTSQLTAVPLCSFLCNVEWVKKIQYRCDMNMKCP